MKKSVLIMATVLSLLAINPLSAQEPAKKKSGLGSFFRNIGERATGMNLSDELIVSMPPELAERVEVLDVVGEGNLASGEVLVTVSVRLVGHEGQLALGGEKSDYATDAASQRMSLSPRDSCSVGMKHLGADSPYHFEFVVQGVSRNLKHFEMMSLGYVYSDRQRSLDSQGGRMAPLTVRNIPISWHGDDGSRK